MTVRNALSLGAMVLACAAFLSCGGETTRVETPKYLPQTSPENVLKNLQAAYENRDSEEYCRLLAVDFRFFSDPGTRQTEGLPEFRLRDEACEENEPLFTDPSVSGLRFLMTYGTPQPSNELGREGWVYIDVDAYLEIDRVPDPDHPGGSTERVERGAQRFFLRQDIGPDDSAFVLWYLAEWRDYGTSGPDYLAPTSPENVLANLQTAYRVRDIEGYISLLADDYHFYFDAGTRQRQGLPEFWSRDEDPNCTAALFDNPEVTDIRIKLTFGSPKAGTTPGTVYIDVLDTFLEVDIAPAPDYPFGLTLRIDGQQQRFYFRKGINPEDTESEAWYLTDWRDYGVQSVAARALRPEVESTTWGAVKALFCR